HSAAWLNVLDQVAEELAEVTTLYLGHGSPAGPAVFAAQRRYLLHYRELVRRLAGGPPQLSTEAQAALEAGLRAFLPDAPLTWMIGLGADAVAAELAATAVTVGGWPGGPAGWEPAAPGPPPPRPPPPTRTPAGPPRGGPRRGGPAP